MPSVGTFKAQPATRAFAITQEQQGAYYFRTSNFNTWYAANSSEITKVGEGLYIVTGDFETVLNELGESQGNSPRFDDRKTLIDLGKEIIVGNEVNSRLVVFRRVQSYGAASVGGAGAEGYVVTENNTTDLASGNIGRFTVRVARI